MTYFFELQKQWLTSLPRTSFLDLFFKSLVFFDTEYFLFVLIPFLWVGVSRNWGIKIYYLLLASAFINFACKELCQLPRPCSEDPTFSLISPPTGCGFPSGAAQTAFLLGSFLLRGVSKVGCSLLGLLYILLVSFSRLYLHVHYPIDILGGWGIGAFLFWLFTQGEKKGSFYLLPKPRLPRFLLCIALCIFLASLFPHPKVLYIMSNAIGVSIGNFLYPETPCSPLFPIQWSKAFLAVGGTFLLAFLLQQLPFSVYLQSFFLGVFLSLGACYLAVRKTPATSYSPQKNGVSPSF